jgi:hypothetical protein
LICVDSVGWLTKLAAAARPKWRCFGESDEIAEIAQVHGLGARG